MAAGGTATTQRPDDRPIPYRPGLSGLRAVAVVGIVLSHAGHDWIPGGGTTGVEIFFVLSGYLTSSLLLALDGASRLGTLARSYGRRARRALPALLTLLGGVSLLVLTTRPDELYRLGPQLRATLVGLVNWQLIVSAGTATAAPSPSFLEHLWPIAVGAQVTALVVAAIVLTGSRRGRARLRLVTLLLAAASTAALVALAMTAEVPQRALYGTDTRATGLLVGVLLALALPAASARAVTGARARRLQVLGTAALVGLLATMAVGGGLQWLARGGALLTDVLTAIVIAVVVRGAPLDRLLGALGMRWVGLRSYALYLWHWPVLLALGGPVVVHRPALTALYLVVVLVLADLTFRFVEVPLGRIRRVQGNGAIGRPGLAVRTTAIACGAACAAALLTGQPRV